MSARRLGDGGRRALSWALSSDWWMVVLAVLYVAALAPFMPELASSRNLGIVLQSALPLAAIAIGQTLVLITGGIDLSATAIVAVASVVGAQLMSVDGPHAAGTAVGVAAMLAVGAATGALNGTAVSRLGMPPFMVTLTAMMFGSGFAVWLTSSKSIFGLPPAFIALGKGTLGPVPYALVLVLAIAAAMHGLLRRTLLGRWIFAVGQNVRAAQISGVPVARTLVLAYIASGLCAAVGAIIYTARLETGSPVLGQRIFLDVIGAAVIGGTSLFGGRGSVRGTLFGALFIAIVDNSLNLFGLTSFTVLIVKGALILMAAALDRARTVLSRGRV